MADGLRTPVRAPASRSIVDLRLPPVHNVPDIRGWVRSNLEAENVKLAVIDDDPTGTQTVQGVPLITAWDDAELEWAVLAANPTFAVLTNARALAEEAAVAVNKEIGERLARTANRLGVELRLISRSDSTLRGHFPAEPEALAEGLARAGQRIDGVLLCPAFPEAGRVTAGDTHWVREGERITPVAETEFAQDAAFGYASSDLKEWIRERAGADATVASVTIEDVRRGGPPRIAECLLEARGQTRYFVANAVETSDLDALALGVELAEQRGMRFVYRTGPSFVSARAGVGTAEPLATREIGMPDGRGLLVVGSHTSLSTRQLSRAMDAHELGVVQLDVEELLGGPRGQGVAALSRAAAELTRALAVGDAALVTSRQSAHAHRGAISLQTAAVVADALVDIVRAVGAEVRLDWLIAKGGITSHDMAVRALGARRATVLGQLFFGKVSVWELAEGSVRPGLRYVVFAGNVGDESTLARTLDRLKGKA